jgi:ATP-dependent Lon protease
MTIEEKLEELIKFEFGSIAECARQTGVHDSTIRTILKRGVSRAHIDTIFPITRALGISAEDLYFGNIVQNDSISRDLSKVVEDFKTRLSERTYRLENNLVSPDDMDELIDTLDFVMARISKKYKTKNQGVSNLYITKSKN